MTNKAGKIWGSTELILSNASLEFHRIEFNARARCSKHLHKTKYNGFWVESGKLLIRVWQEDQGLVDETRLSKGEWCTVAPGKYHEFVGIEDGVAFEVYWAQGLDPTDIVRMNSGGIAPTTTDENGNERGS